MKRGGAFKIPLNRGVGQGSWSYALKWVILGKYPIMKCKQFIIQNGHFLPSQPKKAANAQMIKATHHPPNAKPKSMTNIPHIRSPADIIYRSNLIGRNITKPPQSLNGAKKLAEWYYRE